MATTLLTDELETSDAPSVSSPDPFAPVIIDQPNNIATTTEGAQESIGLRPTVQPDWFQMRSRDIAKREVSDLDFDANLKEIVTSGDYPIANRIAAIQVYDDDSAMEIGGADVLSRNKEAAAMQLDRDITIAKSELFNTQRGARLMEMFPSYKERNEFIAASATGKDNPDAYENPKHKEYVTETNKLNEQLFGSDTRTWEAEAKDDGGHKVADFSIKPTSNGEAMAFLKMRGPDDKLDAFNETVKFKMPTDDEVTSDQDKTAARLGEIKAERAAAQEKINTFGKKPETFGSIISRSMLGVGGGSAPGMDTTGIAVAAQHELINNLNAEEKNLTKRAADLNKDGKRILANERVADLIRNDPNLMAQIPDKGRINQIAVGFRNVAVQMNVLGEELGNPLQAGARDKAAELMAMDAEMGTGGEQSKFRGSWTDDLTNIVIDSAPGMAVSAFTAGAGRLLPGLSKGAQLVTGLGASRLEMGGATYAQSLAQSEMIARQMEDAGDFEGAAAERANMRGAGFGAGLFEVVGESLRNLDELAVLQKWSGGPASWLRRGSVAAVQNAGEEAVTQAGQDALSPYSTGQPASGIFSREMTLAMGAGAAGGFLQQIAIAPFNRDKSLTKEEKLSIATKQMEELAASVGVNPNDKPPTAIDIDSEFLTAPDGKTQVQNMQQMVKREGSQNWSIGDEGWRQRAVQAGVKAEFTNELEARDFAATMQQQIVQAEFLTSLQNTKVNQADVGPMLNWIGLTIKQQAIKEGNDTNSTWARYGYSNQAEIIREAENAIAPESLPPAGTEPAPVESQEQESPANQRVAIKDLKNPRGQIGNQGFTSEGVIALVNHATGSQHEPTAKLKDVLDSIRGNPEQLAKVKAFLEATPIVTYAQPDDTIYLKDGHHRAFLADQIGMESLPTVDKLPTATQEQEAPTAPVSEAMGDGELAPTVATEPPGASPPVAADTPSIPATVENATPARDAKKSEQMTPDEYLAIPMSKKGNLSDASMRQSHKDRVFYSTHPDNGSKPVSAAAVEAYGITLPEGYTKQGDLYVYSKPAETPAPPTTESTLQAGRKAVIKKQAAPKASQPATVTPPGTKLKAKIEGTVQDVEYIRNNNDGTHQVKTETGVTGVRSGNLSENNGGTLFQSEQGETIKGRTSVPDPLGSALITFTSSTDVTTVMHEMIHAFSLLESPLPDGKTISALQSILGNKATALYAWAQEGTEGMTPDDAHRRMHERIAEGFEKWLVEGKLPEGKNRGVLASAFDAIKKAMRNVVQGMLNPDARFRYIEPKADLPAPVMEAYQQLFAMLDNGPTHAADKSQTVLESINKAAAQSADALYPFTVSVHGNRRIAMTPAQIADSFMLPADDPEREKDQRVVAGVVAANENAAKANAGFTLFQLAGNDRLPVDKAKELVDVALPTIIAATVKNNNELAPFGFWLQHLKETNDPLVNDLTPGARETLYNATILNMPAASAIAAQERIDAAIRAVVANEEVSEAEFSQAVNSILPSLDKRIAAKVNAVASGAKTGIQRKAALTSVMRLVRADARAKFSIASNKLEQLLKGYRFGAKNSSHVRDIIREINKVIRPLLKSKEIGKNTKATIEQTMLFVDYATKGAPEMGDIVTMMQRNITAIREDLARHAQTAFLKGVKAGGKFENERFTARQKAIIDVITENLKTVTGLSPARIGQVVNLLRGAKTDKQLSKATWKALLLFQDQRVRDNYAEIEARQARIKANMKAGKFGDLTDWAADFNAFDPDSIPQHMLAQYGELAKKLSGSEPVILLNGVKNQIEAINRQLDEWLEANPQEEQVRAANLSDGFAEALQRLGALEDLDDAKRTRQREKFISRQQEMGKTLEQAKMAARMIDQHNTFQAFEEADEDELAGFSTRQIQGIANSFRNYNEGIVTPYLFKQSMMLRSARMQQVWMPMLQHGVRQFLYMKSDAPLNVMAADFRSRDILKQVGRRLAGYGQVFGKQAESKAIRAQFDSHDHLRYDALMGTFNWMNENVIVPMQQAQVAGIRLRNELMRTKDGTGKTLRDYQIELQEHNDDFAWITPHLDLTLFSTFLTGGASTPIGDRVGQKVAHTKEARREMWSRIMGIYAIQRQREANGMPGSDYATFIDAGSYARKGSKMAVNEERRQKAALTAIMDGMIRTFEKRKAKANENKKPGDREIDLTAMTSANIYELLPQDAKNAIALGDRIFGLTGQMTYYLNMFENEAPLAMPMSYFPIHGMEDKIAIRNKMEQIRGGEQGRSPKTPRADARHARTDERLKFQNADFFGVLKEAVHEAAVDSSMTPLLKLVNESMNGMKARKSANDPIPFAGSALNVVNDLQETFLEYGARYAHAVTSDPGIVRTMTGVAMSLIYRIHLPQVFRPIQESLSNLTLLIGSSRSGAYLRGSKEYGTPAFGSVPFWDKVMIDLNAPTAARGTTEATIGLMHGISDTLSATDDPDRPHVPGIMEGFVGELREKSLAERGTVARLQSHKAAVATKAVSDLSVTLAEKMYVRQLWTGVFVQSIEAQTGVPFSQQNFANYSPQQKQKALAAAELAVAEILAPSARGATRLKAQVPIDDTTGMTLWKNMVYALTSFTGALSSTAKMSVKAVMEGRAGTIDRTAATRNLIALSGGAIVSSALSAIILSGVPGLAAYVAAAAPDGDDDPSNDDENTAKKREDSPHIQRFSKLMQGMNPLDGIGNSGKFWVNRFMQSMFQMRLGGTNSLSRLLAATGGEIANYLVIDATRDQPYDPYRDNFTMEGQPAITAGLLNAFGADDPQLRRALQNSNISDATRALGPIAAMLTWGTEVFDDVGILMDASQGEVPGGAAALDLAVQFGVILNVLPLYKTIMQSTKALRDADSQDYKTYSEGVKEKDAKRLGVDLFYAAPSAKPAIEAQIEKQDKRLYEMSWKENKKLTSFEEAYTIQDNPKATAILKDKLERIRDGKASEMPNRIGAAYEQLEKIGLEGELISGLRYLMNPRKGWEGHFTVESSKGQPKAVKLQEWEIENREDGDSPAWRLLYGRRK